MASRPSSIRRSGMARQPGAPTGQASEASARAEVVATAQEMSRRGLSPGRSGNVSCRWNAGMLITPSGIAYGGMKAADIVFVGDDGMPAAGSLAPSSEWRFHRAVYQARPDLMALVHTHATHATVLACAHRPIPAFHYMVAVAGGTDIPLVPYAAFGSDALADHVVQGLAERNACIMANHGQIAGAASLAAALDLAQQVEVLAEQYLKVLLLGAPHILSDGEMKEVIERFKSYGQPSRKD